MDEIRRYQYIPSRTSPTMEPLDLLHHQHISSRIKVLSWRLCQPILHPCCVLLPLPPVEIQWTRPPNSRDLAHDRGTRHVLLKLVPLNHIVWYYVCYYVWHYVWLNVVINKVSLLLSKIIVTWIFGHYHIVHEMHSMWFNHRRYRSQVFCKLRILVRNRWWNWTFHLRRL